MSHKILIPQDIAEAAKQYLREKGYEVIVGSGYSDGQIKKEMVGCAAVVVRNFAFTREMMEAGKTLKVIARHGVGLDNIDLPAAAQLGIQVTFAPESNSISVAEHTIGFILAAAHRLTLCDRETRKGDFEVRWRLGASDVNGKTLGVVGFGRIGKLVARKAKYGLDMNVVLFDPYLQEPLPGEYRRVSSLDELLSCSDYVTFHIPLMTQTKNLIGSKELHMMKPSACIINAARGGIINETGLYHALKSNTIAYACLDVFEDEPVKANNPLFTLDNILISPHSATLTKECIERMGLHAALGIHEVLSGQKPTWPVHASMVG
jgi:D-3-phosphoglycerate dehydrogenase